MINKFQISGVSNEDRNYNSWPVDVWESLWL